MEAVLLELPLVRIIQFWSILVSLFKQRKDGDSNSKFFLTACRNRIAPNSITVLYAADNTRLTHPKWRRNLLVSSLVSWDLAPPLFLPCLCVRNGPILSRDAALTLCRPLSCASIDQAVASIHVDSFASVSINAIPLLNCVWRRCFSLLNSPHNLCLASVFNLGSQV